MEKFSKGGCPFKEGQGEGLIRTSSAFTEVSKKICLRGSVRVTDNEGQEPRVNDD